MRSPWAIFPLTTVGALVSAYLVASADLDADRNWLAVAVVLVWLAVQQVFVVGLIMSK